MGTGSFPGVKRPGRGADHPPPSSAEVKKELSYTSTPLWAFGSVTGYLYLTLMFEQAERGESANCIVVKHQVPSDFCATLYTYSKLCLGLIKLV
jgi:hypothetical protein